MRLAQAGEQAASEGRQPEARDSPVLAGLAPLHQPRLDASVHESHRGLMAKGQVLRQVADRRAPRVGMAPNGEQQLVLRWRDPGFLRGALAPAKELAKSGPEFEEACVVNLWLVGSGPITWGLRALDHDPHRRTASMSTTRTTPAGAGDGQFRAGLPPVTFYVVLGPNPLFDPGASGVSSEKKQVACDRHPREGGCEW